MSQLQLSLLGVPEVSHGERTLTFPTRKALALLVYLIVEGGTHSRKTLSESFWPELDAEHGRAALRATLLELRKLLERSHEPGELAHLLVERDTLGFDVESPLIMDIQLVESASKQIGRGTPPMSDQAGGELLAQLERATQQADGPFLAGFTLRDSQFFDDWTRQQREYWYLRVHQLFDALSMLYERSGDAERAIETLTRWLNFDPLNEEGYRRLMRLRFSKGDRTGALRAYADCRAVLADQLQVDPEPETIALAKRIRHTAPAQAPQVHSSQLSRTSPGQPPANLLDAPFLGRTAEFGTMIERYQRALAGHPQLVLLEGETGIGKTRLATEFVRWAQAQGADVLVGRALQTGRQLPYQPLIDVLRRGLEQEHTLNDLLSNVWLAELARLLPELRDRYPNLPVPSKDEELGHNRLFEATARLVQVWAARRPMVLLLDDMQWADTATLDLLLYLARSLAEQPAPVLLMLTLCSGAESCTDSQSSWLMALKRTRIPLTALQLAAFSEEETQRFVQGLAWVEQPLQMENPSSNVRGLQNGEARLSRDALEPFANWLYFQTRGQPLYLVEALKELLTRGIIVPSLQENGSWGLVLLTGLLAQTPVGELIPTSVRELIQYQVGRLTPTAWTLLVTGAALGQGLTFECLIEVAQLDEQEGLRALEELLRNGLLCERRLVEDSQAVDGYAFPREMLREVVYQEAGTTRQRLVQQRVTFLMREEETRLLHPAPVDGYESAESGNEQVRWVESRSALGIMHQRSAKDPSGARGKQSDVRGEQILLAIPEMRAGVFGAPEFQRSPPGSAFQSFL
jgi:DNA-binding SARP family transcriptional activator